MEKKSQAKAAMLKELSKEMSDDMYSPMKDMLGKKGMKKVTVASDSPEGLEKGLSMAEKLMKLKSGESSKEEMPEAEYESEEEESPEMEAADEMSEMSPEEMEAMYEMLKQKLGKA
jgi:hypothetical protein